MTTSSNNCPRPFMKWVGGKTQLLPDLSQAVREAGAFNNYHEPFLGGGALFFALSPSLPPREAILSDFNPNLIGAYLGVTRYVKTVICLLKEHEQQHSPEYYYRVRSMVPDQIAARTARIIYLNKTCYNGLYRENSRGLFNVPIGLHKNPTICDEANLFACSKALRMTRIGVRSFESVLDSAEAGDLVYCDPPYHPLSATSSFTAYEKNGFGEDRQRQLADVFTELNRHGVRVVLSNSDTALIRKLYSRFRIKEVMAKRSVNSRADRRGKITELLVQNF